MRGVPELGLTFGLADIEPNAEVFPRLFNADSLRIVLSRVASIRLR